MLLCKRSVWDCCYFCPLKFVGYDLSIDDDNSVVKFYMQCHLIYGSDIGRDLETLLEADDLAVVVNSKHRPRCIIEFISQSLHLLNLDESRRNMLVSSFDYKYSRILLYQSRFLKAIPWVLYAMFSICYVT